MALPPGFSRETRLRRDRFGRWFDGDEPVTNSAIASAFDRWIDRAPDGRYCLKNSVNWAYVEIEGPPIFVKSVSFREGGLELRLSDERTELLDLDTIAMDAEGRLICSVRSRTMPAELTTHAAMQLEPIIDEDDEGIFLRVGERKVRLRSPDHS